MRTPKNQPRLPTELEPLVLGLGFSRARLAILLHLAHQGPTTTPDLQEALELPTVTVTGNLARLEQLDWVTADRPPEIRRRGGRAPTTWRLKRTTIRAALHALSLHLS